MSKEIICVNIGQAGVQISNACWELFCIEHGLDCYGNVRPNTMDNSGQYISNLNAFFNETKNGNYVPRSISVDLEPSVIDEIRSGPYRNLWNPACLVSGLEDAASNFARGYISIGKTMIGRFMDILNKLVQDCDRLHGIIFLHSYSGGTGSGFTNLILDRICSQYAKTSNLASIVFPSPNQSTSLVEPYNCLLSSTTSISNLDIAFLSDNECLYDLCVKRLMIQKPTYNNINRLLSQLYSSLTVSLRFKSYLDYDIVHLQTNLIPFPRIHFPISTFSPISDQGQCDHETLSTSELTQELFDQDNRFISCNIAEGKYMACCLFYRGLVNPKDINYALMEIKRRKDIVFVDWSPVGFKVGVSPMPPASVVQSDLAATNINCSMFFNSTAIEKIWNVIHKKYRSLFHKKSFLHWFIGEGMEESEFVHCEEDIFNLQRDYREIETQNSDRITEPSGTTKVSTKIEEPTDKSSMDDLPEESLEIKECNTNNNLIEEERKSTGSIQRKASSIYGIKKVIKTPSKNDDDDVYHKNRKLLKLFNESST